MKYQDHHDDDEDDDDDEDGGDAVDDGNGDGDDEQRYVSMYIFILYYTHIVHILSRLKTIRNQLVPFAFSVALLRS